MSDDRPTAEERRRRSFESLVLTGIWLIIRLVRQNQHQLGNPSWRGQAIDHMDQWGRPGEEPRKYRREVGFPE